MKKNEFEFDLNPEFLEREAKRQLSGKTLEKVPSRGKKRDAAEEQSEDSLDKYVAAAAAEAIYDDEFEDEELQNRHTINRERPVLSLESGYEDGEEDEESEIDADDFEEEEDVEIGGGYGYDGIDGGGDDDGDDDDDDVYDDDDDDEITEEEYRAMLAAKAAKAESREQSRTEDISEYSPRRNPSMNAKARASHSRTESGLQAGRTQNAARSNTQAGKRSNTQAGTRNSSQSRARNNSQSRTGNYSSQGRRQAAAQKKKKLPIFWICLGVYTLVLLIFAWRFLKYTDDSLVKYENAQSENAMKGFLSEFTAMANSGTLADRITMPKTSGEFESADVYKNMYLDSLKGVKSYAYEKDPGSYLTEEPVYDIMADGEMVAKMTLSASNEHTIFGILTVMDWQIKEILPVFKAASHEYTVKVPDTYKVTVNGVELGEKYLTGTAEKDPGLENVSKYVSIPAIEEYKISGLANTPDIKVYDASGNEVEYTPDANGNVTVAYAPETGEIPQERYDTALDIAKTWDNFLTDDLGGEAHGLSKVQKYLIKDSDYWNLARDYAYGIDITFISAHTMKEPPYSGVALTDYVSYGDNCYSVHIYFEKNMHLTKTGQDRVNVMDSTFWFVYYDDTDDGQDNPHWAIAEMIAATN